MALVFGGEVETFTERHAGSQALHRGGHAGLERIMVGEADPIESITYLMTYRFYGCVNHCSTSVGAGCRFEQREFLGESHACEQSAAPAERAAADPGRATPIGVPGRAESRSRRKPAREKAHEHIPVVRLCCVSYLRGVNDCGSLRSDSSASTTGPRGKRAVGRCPYREGAKEAAKEASKESDVVCSCRSHKFALCSAQ